MAIKAVILDVSGTMLQSNSGSNTVVSGIPDMINSLKGQGITVFAASNDFHTAFTAKGHLSIDSDKILHSALVGGKKGTKKFVTYVSSQFSIEPHELLYLGDSKTDMLEAVNSQVAFFLAAWSNSSYPYGIRLETPQQFVKIFNTFFTKNDLWYYTVDDVDGLNRSVKVRALLDPDKSGKSGVKDLIKSKGTKGLKIINGYTNAQYLSMHLFASIYMEGLHRSPGKRNILWCRYPGHDGSYESILSEFIKMISQAFNMKAPVELVQRHTLTDSSSHKRYTRKLVSIDDQLKTIQLNPASISLVEGKPIIVIDDFTTDGYGFETARNYLLNAKAESVTCIAVGKYPRSYIAYSPKAHISWDSFSPSLLTGDMFNMKAVKEYRNDKALRLF